MRATERIALVVCLSAIGCTVYGPPPGGTLTSGRSIRVTSASPMTLGTTEGIASGASLCQVSGLDGQLDRELADTLVLRGVHRLTRTAVTGASPSGQSCPRLQGSLLLVRSAESTVTERRVSGKRTTLLLAGIAAAVLAFAALAASQMEYDWGPSSVW